jgi:beta-glucosidase
MKPQLATSLLIACACFLGPASAHENTAADATAREKRIEELLSQLTLDEKLRLIAGDPTGFAAAGVPRLGIPAIQMADGPVGVRIGASNAYPVSVNVGATFDPELALRYGTTLAEDTLAKGKHAILAPCVGITRFPLGGRNFETLGEDAWLNSRLAVAIVKGIQSRNVLPAVKHFAGNDQEWHRWEVNAVIDERTLHETHLLPFEATVKEADAWMVMSSYNKINGAQMSENRTLLRDILKDRWGFQGLVVSDWDSVHSTVPAALNGLDIEMPSPKRFGQPLKAAIEAGEVPVSAIDDKVRRHLRVRMLAGIFERPVIEPDESVIRSQGRRDFAREIAVKSMVLLKNENLLPLAAEKIKTLALVGPNAAALRSGGGGSSGVWPWASTNPIEGFRQALGGGVKITHAPGVLLDRFQPASIPVDLLRTPDGSEPGYRGEYFGNPEWKGEPQLVRTDAVIDFDWKKDGPGSGLPAGDYSVRWTATFTPSETRDYDLASVGGGSTWVFLDDKKILDNAYSRGIDTTLRLEAGRKYKLRVDFKAGGGNASPRFGWRDLKDPKQNPQIADAVALAREADAAVLCVGLSATQEFEGEDVPGFELANNQAALIEQVLAAQPNTVVVIYGGVPVLLKPWLEKARAVVAAFYPGQEGGAALADLVLGAKNFSGRLPFSYIQEKSQSPGFLNYQNPDLQAPYKEGVFVGYKYYDKYNIKPVFPFGHGLSYTTFKHSDLKVSKSEISSDALAMLSLTVSNTGKVKGDEIVQIYIEPKQSKLPRPIRELKDFFRVADLAPGESRTVTRTLGKRAFAYYDPAQSDWVLDTGKYLIHSAASSRAPHASATLELP